MEITGHTHMISLIGSPIRHSASPVTHNYSFDKLGVDTVYLAFDVQPDALEGVVAAMRSMDGWDGSNVTMPCKQAIIPYLDGLSDAAELMGAVNVVKKEADGRLIGHNSDGLGFMDNLRNHGVVTEGASMVLLGAGGAGSAILVQAALDGVKTLKVFAREGGKSYRHTAELLPRVIEKTGCDVQLLPLEDAEALKAAIAEADILANSTNVGMGDESTESPVPAEYLVAGRVVADVIYHPLKTKLLADAEAAGCTIVPGIGMMVEQAAVGERVWYDVEMPSEEITEKFFS